MKPGVPWSVKGIDGETREAAKDAARRSGMTLGEWLNTVILQQSEEVRTRPQPAARHGHGKTASRSPGRPQPVDEASDVHSRLETLAAKLTALAEGEQETAVTRFMGSARRPNAHFVDPAPRNMLDRIERHEQQTRDVLEQIFNRIDVLDRELAELAEEGLATTPPPPEVTKDDHTALETALRNIVDHLETSERRTRDTLRSIHLRLSEVSQRAMANDDSAFGGQLATVEGKLSGLAARLEQLEQDAMAGRTEQVAMTVAQREVRSIERKLDGLARQVETAERAAASPPGIERLLNEVESLNQRCDDLKAETASDRDLRLLGQTVEQLAAQMIEHRAGDMDPAVVSQISELEGRIDNIDLGLRQVLEQQALVQEAIQHLESHATPQKQMMDALHRQITQFGDRLGATENRLGHLATLDTAMTQLYQGLEESRTALSRPSSELQALQEGLEAVRTATAQSDQRSQETLEAVHETLEQIILKLSELETHGVAEPMVNAPPYPEASAEAVAPIEQMETIQDTMTWQHVVRAHLAAQAAMAAPEPSPPVTDFRLPPLDDWSSRSEAEQAMSETPASQPDAAPVGNAAPDAAAMRQDFIAAARRAAQAAQPPAARRPLGDRSDAAGLLARLGIRRGRAPQPEKVTVPPPAGGLRRRLIMAGLVLLAVVSAYAINARVTPPATPPTSAPATPSGHSDVLPPATPLQDTVAPAAPRLPEPDHPGKASSADPFAGLTTASVSEPPAGNLAVAVQKIVESAPASPPDGFSESLWQAGLAGDAIAQFVIATSYLDGRGLAKDEVKAAEWFDKSAAQGLAPAQYRLATMCERGRGIARDEVRARHLYEQAARQGNIRAMHNLAVMIMGNEPASAHVTTAAKWFTEAAAQGLKDSQYNLAILYERGMGFERNLGEATFWYAVAAADGDADAKARLDTMKIKLAKKDLERHLKRATDFRAKAVLREANVVSISDPSWGVTAGPQVGPLSQRGLVYRDASLSG